MRLKLFARHHAAAAAGAAQPPAHDLHSLHAHHYLRPGRPLGGAAVAAEAAAAAAAATTGAGAGAASLAAAVPPPPGHPLTHAAALTAYESVLACLIVLHALAFCLLGYKLWRWSVDEAGGKGAKGGGRGASAGGARAAPMPPTPLARFTPGGAGHHSGPLKRQNSIQSVRDALKQYVKVNIGKH
jgi:hypothetical protein